MRVRQRRSVDSKAKSQETRSTTNSRAMVSVLHRPPGVCCPLLPATQEFRVHTGSETRTTPTIAPLHKNLSRLMKTQNLNAFSIHPRPFLCVQMAGKGDELATRNSTETSQCFRDSVDLAQTRARHYRRQKGQHRGRSHYVLPAVRICPRSPDEILRKWTLRFSPGRGGGTGTESCGAYFSRRWPY
jgi:hypothetical protein